jgi:hypothetical protein
VMSFRCWIPSGGHVRILRRKACLDKPPIYERSDYHGQRCRRERAAGDITL